MKILPLLLLYILLVGCSSYGNHFDCPMPDNAVSCKSVSLVSKELRKSKKKTTIVYQGDETCSCC